MELFEKHENWKDITDPYWGKYFQVSDRGRIRAKDYISDAGRNYKGYIVRVYKTKYNRMADNMELYKESPHYQARKK